MGRARQGLREKVGLRDRQIEGGYAATDNGFRFGICGLTIEFLIFW